ncbi:MAG: hypothetical protein ABEJ04_04635 [Halobacteriaceae archaeon]
MSRGVSRLAAVVGVVVVLCLVPALASAAVSTSIQTSYNGTRTGSDQAVQVTYTITPDGGTINNLTVDFGGTAQSFVESSSFSYTVSPGGAEVGVQSRGGDRFFIRRLDSNEEVTFTFETYPKTIKEERLDVAAIHLEYVQNGQRLTKTDTVETDLSDSPWFALQQSRSRVDALQQRTSGMRLTMFGGGALGVLGVVVAVGAVVWKRRSVAGLKDDLEIELDQLESRMVRNGLGEESTEHKEYKNWRRDVRSQLGIDYEQRDPGPMDGPGPSGGSDGDDGFGGPDGGGNGGGFGDADSDDGDTGFSDSDGDGGGFGDADSDSGGFGDEND